MSPIRIPLFSRSLALSSPNAPTRCVVQSGTNIDGFQEQAQGLRVRIRVLGPRQAVVEFGKGDDAQADAIG